MLNANQQTRFWEKVSRCGDDECWLWTASTNSSGYGRFSIGGRRLEGAHRVSLRLAGQDIPDGMVVDHVCRTRLCVNPAHLRVVTRFVNVHENSNAPAHLNAAKTHCPQGHPYSGDNLFIRRLGWRGCRECSRVARRKSDAKAKLRGPTRQGDAHPPETSNGN